MLPVAVFQEGAAHVIHQFQLAFQDSGSAETLIRVMLDPLEELVHNAEVVVEVRIEAGTEAMKEADGPHGGDPWSRWTGLPQRSLKGPEQDMEDGRGGPGSVMEEGPEAFGHGEDELADGYVGKDVVCQVGRGLGHAFGEGQTLRPLQVWVVVWTTGSSGEWRGPSMATGNSQRGEERGGASGRQGGQRAGAEEWGKGPPRKIPLSTPRKGTAWAESLQDLPRFRGRRALDSVDDLTRDPQSRRSSWETGKGRG